MRAALEQICFKRLQRLPNFSIHNDVVPAIAVEGIHALCKTDGRCQNAMPVSKKSSSATPGAIWCSLSSPGPATIETLIYGGGDL
jgi:hypothetical protein